jgi:hypothetical protein
MDELDRLVAKNMRFATETGLTVPFSLQRGALFALTSPPEGHAKSNQKYSSQDQKEHGLLEP